MSVKKYQLQCLSVCLLAVAHISCSGALTDDSGIDRIFFPQDQVAFDDIFLNANGYVQIAPDTSLAHYHEANADYLIPKGTTVQYVTLLAQPDTVLYYHYYYTAKDGCEGLPPNEFEFHFDSDCTSSGFYRK
jgi:hypothetical protein